MKIRRSSERGHFENEWLNSYHSFSFADYFDPKHMHFSDLRVINHDFIAASQGFPKHGHRDMEIITYVLKGAVEHEDSMGNKAQVQAGEVQVMGAGTGVLHSEKNPSSTQELELLQIWVMPARAGGAPHYAQKKFDIAKNPGVLTQLISPDGAGGSLQIHQDTSVYAAALKPQQKLDVALKRNRSYWLQIAEGSLQLQTAKKLEKLNKGDAVYWEAGELENFKAQGLESGEFLLFDLRAENS